MIFNAWVCRRLARAGAKKALVSPRWQAPAADLTVIQLIRGIHVRKIHPRTSAWPDYGMRGTEYVDYRSASDDGRPHKIGSLSAITELCV